VNCPLHRSAKEPLLGNNAQLCAVIICLPTFPPTCGKPFASDIAIRLSSITLEDKYTLLLLYAAL